MRLEYFSTSTVDGPHIYDWLAEEDIVLVDPDTGLAYLGSCYEGFQSMRDEVEDFLGSA